MNTRLLVKHDSPVTDSSENFSTFLSHNLPIILCENTFTAVTGLQPGVWGIMHYALRSNLKLNSLVTMP